MISGLNVNSVTNVLLSIKNLTKHMLIHSGIKEFQCIVCENKFTEKGTLKKHMLTHTKEKPHECEICKKKFSQKFSLNDHIRTHTGDRPFGCDRYIL